MKNKYIYIIVLLLTALLLISIEIRHQTNLRHIDILSSDNATLTAENEALIQRYEDLELEYEILERSTAFLQDIFIKQMDDIADLQDTVITLTEENTQLKVQQTKVPEAQKTNRSADRPRYNLTDAERDLVERVVMAESGGESYEGQILVAQCILNACEIDGIRPAKVIKKYVYAKGRPKPTDSVVRAVETVFDRGETVTSEPIVYFYAPGVVRSEFHERQIFAVEEGGHRFFCAR